MNNVLITELNTGPGIREIVNLKDLQTELLLLMIMSLAWTGTGKITLNSVKVAHEKGFSNVEELIFKEFCWLASSSFDHVSNSLSMQATNSHIQHLFSVVVLCFTKNFQRKMHFNCFFCIILSYFLQLLLLPMPLAAFCTWNCTFPHLFYFLLSSTLPPHRQQNPFTLIIL